MTNSQDSEERSVERSEEEKMCDCCKASDVELEDYSPPFHKKDADRDLLCALCATSYVGNEWQHRPYDEDVRTRAHINWVGNEILKAISKKEPSK